VEPGNDTERSVARWLSRHSAEVGWRPLSGDDTGEFDLGPGSSHSAVLHVVDDAWQLRLHTAKGQSLPVLGPVDSSLDVILDALMFALYMRATAELDRPDRSASAQLALVLHRLAEATDDARYAGRAALLLAGHAVKDGRDAEARAHAEDAVRLFAVARDLTAEENARGVLERLVPSMDRPGA